MELQENTNYEGQNILIKVKGKKEPKILVKTSSKCAYWIDDEGKMRYSTFKKVAIYNEETDSPIKSKTRFKKTEIEQLPLWGGHMPSPPDTCKRPKSIFMDGRTGLT